MNKKLLAVAVASAMAAPIAAHADSSLTVYGGVGIAVESIDNDGANDALGVNNNHSAIGFEGSTDINGDLAAVFHWDAFVDLDAGGGNAGGNLINGGRDGWAGLRGSFGTVALGFQGRPWKTLSHGLDPFQGTIADYSSVLGNANNSGTYFDGGIGNAIIWFGPNINGFTWHAQYGTEDSETNTSGGANDYGLQVNYSNDKFFIGASIDENEGTTSRGAEDESAFKIVGSVNFGAATVTAAYEQIDGAGFVNGADRDAFWIAGTIPVGHGSVRVAYTTADDLDNAANTGVDQFSLGYFGDLTDNSQWYVIYSAIGNDSAATNGFTSQPHTSDHQTGAPAAGDDATAITVGFSYNFAADLI